MTFEFQHSYAEELDGLYVEVAPSGFSAPRLSALNEGLCGELGLSAPELREHGAGWLSGSELPTGARPIAQAYAGHQFGNLSPQLGDGRAMLLGEIIDARGQRLDVQLKGSGRTPFSRGGDGLAALGPMLREFLVSESMHALGIRTTRSLAVVTTGESVQRNRELPGAVLTRIASSHIRVGTFQYFAVRNDLEKLSRLCDYTIARHYPEIAADDNPPLALLRKVTSVQMHLVAQWMLVGFVHGVMNTDNVSIAGEAIDYGPCAFMEAYDPTTVFSSIDHGGRYAYGNQPVIARWNMARFAETLLPLIDADLERAVDACSQVLQQAEGIYERAWTQGMLRKIGLGTDGNDEEQIHLARMLLARMQSRSADFTNAFRALAKWLRGDLTDAERLLNADGAFGEWFREWMSALKNEGRELNAIANDMDRVNPIYIPRNQKVEEALAAAEAGEPALFLRLFDVLRRPYDENNANMDYAKPAPENFGSYVTFCGT
ncbi:MAG: YdiU family protein [Polyangiales bacterium]